MCVFSLLHLRLPRFGQREEAELREHGNIVSAYPGFYNLAIFSPLNHDIRECGLFTTG
ncbi:MAG: hypothetical protein GTO24_23310 [candidate division Zixibacteria bacterium]|nr:hypothetical protein [candidate division Zixibacteria bacterium]